LVDAVNNNHIWSSQYNRKFSDMFVVHEQIAGEILDNLRVKLSPEDKNRLEVYKLYQSGRYYWNKRTADELKKAIEYFNQVVDKDPRYALAYAGLADCYNLLALYSGGLSPKETYPKAKDAALKALEIDDALAEAHSSLAWVRWCYDRDWADAEREFKRAIELKADYPTAHQWYANYLAALGRFDEALARMQRAEELDPFSRVIKADLGATVYYYSRDYEKSVAQLRKTLDVDPNFSAAHWWLGDTLIAQKKYDLAASELNKALTLSGGSTRIMADLGYTHGMSGRQNEARKILEKLKEESKRTFVSPYETALIYTGLGDKDQALSELERAFEYLPWELVTIKVEPMLDSLRSDPRFRELERRIGLSP